jgi:hypothetical protein
MNCKELTQKGLECSRDGKYLGCCAQHLNQKIFKEAKGVKLIDIKPAKDGKHKFVAYFKRDDGSEFKTPFGAYGYDDVTLTKDLEQRDRYLQRHRKDLNTYNPTSAGYLSYFVLWQSPDLKKNIREYKKMFNL